MFAVDTNLLLYAAVREYPEHEKAGHVLQAWRTGQEPWFVTWNCVYEFLRVSTHASVLPKPLPLKSSLEFVQVLVDTPYFSIVNEKETHYAVLQDLATKFPRVSANLVHDFHTAAILYEQGIRVFYTADRDFLRFDFLQVIDPVH